MFTQWAALTGGAPLPLYQPATKTLVTDLARPEAARERAPAPLRGVYNSPSLGTTCSVTWVTQATGSGPIEDSLTRSMPSLPYSSMLARKPSTSSSGSDELMIVFWISAGSRPSSSQCRVNTSSLRATNAGSGVYRLQASA